MSTRLVGTTTEGSAGVGANTFLLSKFTAVASGNTVEVHVYPKANSNVKVAIYADNAGAPGALLAANNDSTAVTANQWNTISIGSVNIVQDTPYWLAINCSATSGVGYTGSGGTSKYKAATYSTFTFPDPAGSGFTGTSFYYSLAAWGNVGVPLTGAIAAQSGLTGELTGGSSILERQLSDSADYLPIKYSVSPGWAIWQGGGSIVVGYCDSLLTRMGGGFRFQNITIPPGAIIDTAYLKLAAYGDLDSVTVNSVIIGQKATNPDAFSTLADYQARRGTICGGANNNNITSASITWNAIATWINQEVYDSPELKTIIQEIIDQPGWVSGNSLILFWDDHGDNSTHPSSRSAFADPSLIPGLQPILHIEYRLAALLVGDIAAGSTVQGTMVAARKLAGAIAAQSGAEGVLSVAWVLAGTCSSQASIEAVLNRSRTITGTAAGQALVQGLLGVIKDIAGTIAGQSAVTGSLSKPGLIGGLTAEAAVEGVLAAQKKMTGQVAAQAAVQADLARIIRIAGAVAAQSSLTGECIPANWIEGIIAAVSTVEGAMLIGKALAGDVAAQTGIEGYLSVPGGGQHQSQMFLVL